MASGTITTLDIAPGVQKNLTEYQAHNSWVSVDKVRFHHGIPEKLGGWQKPVTTNTYRGIARAILPWAALDGTKYIALGTHNSLWIYNGGTFYDVTPIRASINSVSCFFGTSGSNVVHCSVANHGAQTDDLVQIETSAGLSDGGHSVSSGLYKIVSAGTQHFDISVASAATSTYTAEGDETVVFRFLIQSGLKDNGALFGWGSDAWGDGAWGEAGTGGINKNLRQWSLANWGEDLVASPANGGIYLWQEVSGTGVRASIINNAPTQNNVMFMSQPARQLVVCGTSSETGDFDPMLVRWSDIEDYTTWTAEATNGAGDFRLQSGSKIVGVAPSKKEHVIFTDEGAYSMTFEGAPDYFSFDRLGSNCGLISKNAAVDVNGVVYWMSNSSFYRYAGVVEELPSALDEVVFDRNSPIAINFEQKEKIYAGINSEFSEVWWFYPSGESTDNDRYVIYNYADNIWYDGTLNRSAWVDSDLYDTPLATEPTSVSCVFFEHESGVRDNNTPMGCFLRSGELEMDEGNNLLFIDKYIPDFVLQDGTLKVSFDFRKYPGGDKVTKGPYTINTNTDKISLRGRGRTMNITIQSSGADTYFRIGDQRVRGQADGER